MRTLYISDLDGTLLNSEAKLSNKTTSMINHLIENGLLFTIVTARSYKSAIERITPLNLNIPIGFTYGAIAYDPTSKKNLIKNLIPYNTTNSIFDLFTQSQLSPTLVHTLDNSEQLSDFNWIAITHDFGNKNWIANWLKKYTNADKIVAFGDSLNDLPLFEAADAKCVVENGVSELKQQATQIVGSNNEDGVANYLAGCMNEKVTK